MSPAEPGEPARLSALLILSERFVEMVGWTATPTAAAAQAAEQLKRTGCGSTGSVGLTIQIGSISGMAAQRSFGCRGEPKLDFTCMILRMINCALVQFRSALSVSQP